MQQLIEWVGEHPYKFIIIAISIFMLVYFIQWFFTVLFNMDDVSIDDKSFTDESKCFMDELQYETHNIAMYAGCLGNCRITFQYLPGIPTMDLNELQFGQIKILKVNLNFGLHRSENIYPHLTQHQQNILCSNVYKEYEQKVLLISN